VLRLFHSYTYYMPFGFYSEDYKWTVPLCNSKVISLTSFFKDCVSAECDKAFQINIMLICYIKRYGCEEDWDNGIVKGSLESI
jgi:hypothetical protein